jgi:hypothetical protein
MTQESNSSPSPPEQGVASDTLYYVLVLAGGIALLVFTYAHRPNIILVELLEELGVPLPRGVVIIQLLGGHWVFQPTVYYTLLWTGIFITIGAVIQLVRQSNSRNSQT